MNLRRQTFVHRKSLLRIWAVVLEGALAEVPVVWRMSGNAGMSSFCSSYCADIVFHSDLEKNTWCSAVQQNFSQAFPKGCKK
jgi:hypothetical protein